MNSGSRLTASTIPGQLCAQRFPIQWAGINLGAGRFEDATRAAGLEQPEGKTLGVAVLDHDRDGWPDLAVANDTVRNFLFLNRKDGTFRETGLETGLAYSESGAPRGGMGIDAADADGDGLEDVVIGNFAFEMAGSVKAMDLAYRVTRRGGTTVSAGLSHPEHDFALKHVGLVAEERTIKGSYIGSCVPERDLPRFIALYRQGRLPVDRLMSGTLPLEQINQGFDRLHDGTAIRQVVTL